MAEIIFISGIDTDAGKSYATGFLARLLAEEGKKVVTQKFIQTGNTGFSEDIELHRLLTATGPLEADRAGLTAPIILSYPASAQLAARLDGVEIDLSLIDNATARLAEEFDTVLIEGAGGLMVPITDDFFAIDY
ncbi:MAG: dethiobiotin synthase, partial [Paramuribaculum sp.]|nr:dethiobiotin synthase [Paramuribaculum sp.]